MKHVADDTHDAKGELAATLRFNPCPHCGGRLVMLGGPEEFWAVCTACERPCTPTFGACHERETIIDGALSAIYAVGERVRRWARDRQSARADVWHAAFVAALPADSDYAGCRCPRIHLGPCGGTAAFEELADATVVPFPF